ncbi:TRPM8 channel-associated factor 2-like [Pituophis catenifer annectens]|uniref:TRPM8 channel-associated factor 2-like n=1 Tax=Pituophis catenifer annectens TaxID=94852 RepID=UPI00399216EA
MDSQRSYDLLVKGIQSIDVTGDFNPCKLLLTGDRAQPVLKDSKGQVLIAAAQYGKGRMVVTAHEAMLKLPQFLLFVKNALDWLKPSPTAVVGVHRRLDDLSKLLHCSGIKVCPDATIGDSLGVFCRDAYDDVQAEDLVQFVKRGGGLLIGGQAWHWSYRYGEEAVLDHFPGNLVTGVAGVYFTATVGEHGIFPVSEIIRRDPVITQSTNSSINSQHAYNSLLRGIRSIDVTGDFNPCELLLTGDQAFPVLVGSNGQILIAAAQYGKGRMVVTAHEAMIQLPQFLPFIKNALEWLRRSLTAHIGVHRSLDALSNLLLSSGIEVHPDAILGNSLGVFCRDAYDSAQADDLVKFVQRGGGLLIGGQAWYWSYQHGKEGVLAQFPGNLVTGKAGVYFTAKEGQNGIFPVPEKIGNDPSTTQPTNSPIHIQYDYSSLLQGIQSIDVMGDFRPCELLLTGDQTFPLLVGSNGQVLIAAVQYGKGRMVVTAHEAMIQLLQFLPFIKNALDWLKSSPTALIGVHRSLDALSKLLLGNGIKVHPDATLEDSPGVFCRDAYEDVQADDLVQFVKRGGGLLIGGQAWHWSSEHGKEAVLVRFPGNLVTSVAGVYFTGNVGENGVFSVPEKIPRIPLITE